MSLNRYWPHVGSAVRGVFLATLLMCGWWRDAPAARGGSFDEPIDFAHDIVPILKRHCVPCHGGGKQEGDFSLTTRRKLLESGMVEPGRPSASRLWELVSSSDPDDQMPPAGKARLSSEERDKLRRWIATGVPWQDGFSFTPSSYEPPLRPRRPALPPVHHGRRHPIDRLIDSYLIQSKIDLPESADDATFLRRVYFDLIGLPPTPHEVAAFRQNNSPHKRTAVIDSLLARNEDYAAHWMSYWNDLLRNAYAGTGFIDGGRRQITEWLYGALLHNKPYDVMVRELLAPTEASAGFIRGIKWRGNVNASQTREIQFAQSVSQVFLGINMKCASCHDSFIDRWKLADAYGLAAIYAERPLEIFRCDRPTGERARPAWLFPELGRIDPTAPRDARLRRLAQLMTMPDNGRFTRTIVNRIWQRLMGRGIVHPVDAMQTRPWNEDLLDYLAVDFAEHGYDLKHLMRRIVTSQAYQSRSVIADERSVDGPYRFRGPQVKRLTAEQFLDAVRSVTGVWPQPSGKALKPDGRGQGGQLAAVLKAEGKNGPWGDRSMRTVFTFSDPLQAALGRPNREQVVTVRPETVTTLEAIHLANGQILADIIRSGAARLMRKRKTTPDWLRQIVLYALGREPSRAEQAMAREMVSGDQPEQGMQDLLWALFMSPEFQFVR